MPDQADVEAVLATLIAEAVYPGTAGVSAIGTECRVYRGWPVAGMLETDLGANIAHVTVQPVAGSLRDTTRFSREWHGAAPPCPLMAVVEEESVTFSGAAASGIVAGVLVDGQAYAWRVIDPATPGVVAAALAEMVRANRPVELSGNGIRFPGGRGIVARAVSDGQGGQELRRQQGLFRVTLWCPTPDVRDRLAAFVDLSLAGSLFLDVGGWGCRLQAAGGRSSDEGGARIWRRDLNYKIEYPTVRPESLPSMLFGSGTVNQAIYFV